MITKEKTPWCFIKISQLILKGNVWRSVWRICMWILGLKGLSNNNGDRDENVTEKWSRAASHIIALHLVQFVKCRQFFLEFNSKRLYRSWGKEKESHRLVITSSAKCQIRHFHVVVVQWRQSCCFANLNLFAFFAVHVEVAVVVA